MTDLLERDLRKLLTDFRYQSSMGLGARHLMPHHIDALVKDLLPFIKKEAAKSNETELVAGQS